MKIDLKEKNISRFRAPITATTPVATVSLVDVYNEIVGDSLKEITEQHRTIDNENEARESKKTRFPWITTSGIFTKREDKSIVLHSKIIGMDYDYVKFDLNVAKQMLINDPIFHTLLLFVSPSGKGLKWFVNIDLEKCDHKTWYTAIANYTRERYGLEADMGCKALSQACFLCHDPEAYACSEIMNVIY